MPNCKDNCGRPSVPGSDYCKICERSHQGAPKSLAENTALVQRIAGSQETQGSFGLVGGGASSLKLPEVHDAPAFTGDGGRGAKFGGWMVGLFFVVGAVAVIVLMGKSFAQGVRENIEIQAAQANVSSEQSSEIIPTSTKSTPDYSEVRMSFRAEPSLDTGGLGVKYGETGIIYVKVRGLEDDEYYTRWSLIKPELIGIVAWNQTDYKTIEVSINTALPFSASSSKDPQPLSGRDAFEVKLYAKADDTLLYTGRIGVQGHGGYP